MGDTMVIGASSHSLRTAGIYSYLKIDDKKLNQNERQLLAEIMGILARHKIDGETGAGILKSFESKSKPKDSLDKRLESFCKFLNSVDHREGLIDSVQNLGMLSKEELEEQARETGDWVSVIKRNESDNRRKEERDNQANALRPAPEVR